MFSAFGVQGLIFWREAVRISRRKRIYVLRTVVCLSLIVLFALVYGVSFYAGAADVSTGSLGRYTYYALVYGTLVLSSVLAPIFAIVGVQEEQEQGTLPLLAMTSITPRNLLWSKVLSCILLIVVMLSAVAPLGTLSLYFGGVDPQEIWAWLYFLILSTVLLSATAAIFSFASRGVALPFIATMGFAVWVYFLVPFFAYGTLINNFIRPTFIVRNMPFVFTAEAITVETGLFFLMVGGVVTRLFFVGGHLLRNRADSVDNPKGRIWPGFDGAWLLHILVVFVLWLFEALFSSVFFEHYEVAIQQYSVTWVFRAGYGLLYLVLFYSLSILYIRCLFWLMRGLDRVSMSNWIYSFRGQFASKDSKWSRVFFMGKTPVFWREVFTFGNGASGRVLFLMVGFWLFGVFLVGLVDDLNGWFRLKYGFVIIFTTFACSVISGTVLLTSSFLGERQSGTLSLLQISTLPSYRLVQDKIFASWVRSAPFWVLVWLSFFLSAALKWVTSSPPALPLGVVWFPFGGAFSIFLWFSVLQLFLLSCCAYSAVFFKNARTVWLVNVSGTVLFPVGGVAIFADLPSMIPFNLPSWLTMFVRNARDVLLPWVSHYYKGPVLEQSYVFWEFGAAIVLWFALSLLFTGLAARKLRDYDMG